MLSEVVCNFLLQVGSVLIGGLITWVVSYFYYKKAGDDLKREAQELHKLSRLIINSIEESGLATFNRDEEGNPKGLVLNASAHDGIITSSKPSSIDTE